MDSNEPILPESLDQLLLLLPNPTTVTVGKNYHPDEAFMAELAKQLPGSELKKSSQGAYVTVEIENATNQDLARLYRSDDSRFNSAMWDFYDKKKRLTAYVRITACQMEITCFHDPVSDTINELIKTAQKIGVPLKFEWNPEYIPGTDDLDADECE